MQSVWPWSSIEGCLFSSCNSYWLVNLVCRYSGASGVGPNTSVTSRPAVGSLVSAQYCRCTSIANDHLHWAMCHTHAATQVFNWSHLRIQFCTCGTAWRCQWNNTRHSTCQGQGQLSVLAWQTFHMLNCICCMFFSDAHAVYSKCALQLWLQVTPYGPVLISSKKPISGLVTFNEETN